MWQLYRLVLWSVCLLSLPCRSEVEKPTESAGAKVPVDILIARLDSESFQERMAARRSLVERLRDPSDPGLTDLLAARYSKSPEVRDQANTALREIFGLQVLGAGRRDCGVEWIYWMDRRNDKTFAHPFIRSLKPESFLSKAGLMVGDVVESCAGSPFNQRGSIVALEALLESAPSDKPLKMTVLRPDPRKLTKDRIKSITVEIVPAGMDRTLGRAEKPGEFDTWLKSLGKTGTVPTNPER